MKPVRSLMNASLNMPDTMSRSDPLTLFFPQTPIILSPFTPLYLPRLSLVTSAMEMDAKKILGEFGNTKVFPYPRILLSVWRYISNARVHAREAVSARSGCRLGLQAILRQPTFTNPKAALSSYILRSQ